MTEGRAEIEILRGRTLTVVSPTPLPIVVDGEQPGTTPLSIDMLPRAITVRVPADPVGSA